jgi:hypothetical protein
MKLYKFVLLGIIILSLLFGTRTTREGISAARRKEKERAAAEAKAARKAEYAKREYGGIIAIQNQITLLDTIKTRVRGIPSFELEPTARKEINNSLDIVIDNLKTWFDNRIKYLAIINPSEYDTSDKNSIDGLKLMWYNNGTGLGLRVLVDGISERLNVAEDSQNDVDKLLKTFVTNMNMELGIVISDTQQTDASVGDFGEFGELGDYATDTIDDILGEGGIGFEFPEEENLTYEERYA